jgi:hypothetical protein
LLHNASGDVSNDAIEKIKRSDAARSVTSTSAVTLQAMQANYRHCHRQTLQFLVFRNSVDKMQRVTVIKEAKS